MRKLKLEIEELQVESFEVAPKQGARVGTVHGAAGEPVSIMQGPGGSGWLGCISNTQCVEGTQCGGFTCEFSCGGSCIGTCNVTCTCNSCVYSCVPLPQQCA